MKAELREEARDSRRTGQMTQNHMMMITIIHSITSDEYDNEDDDGDD